MLVKETGDQVKDDGEMKPHRRESARGDPGDMKWQGKCGEAVGGKGSVGGGRRGTGGGRENDKHDVDRGAREDHQGLQIKMASTGMKGLLEKPEGMRAK